MFDGLRSRWTTPSACAAPSAPAACRPSARTSRNGSGPRADAHRQRLAFDELHRDERPPVRAIADFVHDTDVRVVERRRRARFLLQPLASAGISRQSASAAASRRRVGRGSCLRRGRPRPSRLRRASQAGDSGRSFAGTRRRALAASRPPRRRRRPRRGRRCRAMGNRATAATTPRSRRSASSRQSDVEAVLTLGPRQVDAPPRRRRARASSARLLTGVSRHAGADPARGRRSIQLDSHGATRGEGPRRPFSHTHQGAARPTLLIGVAFDRRQGVPLMER